MSSKQTYPIFFFFLNGEIVILDKKKKKKNLLHVHVMRPNVNMSCFN